MIVYINLLLQNKDNITEYLPKSNTDYLREIYNISVNNWNLAKLLSLFFLILASYAY